MTRTQDWEASLDNWITGRYGEDQFKDIEDDDDRVPEDYLCGPDPEDEPDNFNERRWRDETG